MYSPGLEYPVEGNPVATNINFHSSYKID